MSDKLKDLRSCARGRRKEVSNDLTANLPKVNKQDLIDRILVKPYVTDPRCPDLSLLSSKQANEANVVHRVQMSKIEPLVSFFLEMLNMIIN